MQKRYILLIFISLAFLVYCSCSNERKQEKTNEKIRDKKWTHEIDPIGMYPFAISYYYPRELHKDFYLNGICIGNDIDSNSRYPNDMKLSIWINDQFLETDSNIIYQEKPNGAKTTKIENIMIDTFPSLKVTYLDEKSVKKQIAIFNARKTKFKIFAQDIDTTTFNIFLSKIRIIDLFIPDSMHPKFVKIKRPKI